MPSSRDEGRRPKTLDDASSDPSKNQTEKKPTDVADQLASLQENLRRLNEIRQRIHQVSDEDDTETKKKNSAKTGSTNVIRFPVPPRLDEHTTAPEQVSPAKRSTTPPQDTDETRSLPTDELSSAHPIVVEEPAHSGLEVSEPFPNRSGEEFTPAASYKADATENIDPVETSFTAPHHGTQPLWKAEPDEPEVISPEVVSSSGPAIEPAGVPSKRPAAVDAEIRALLKEYGEVDIYSRPDNSATQNLVKIAVAALALIVVLMASYLFLGR